MIARTLSLPTTRQRVRWSRGQHIVITPIRRGLWEVEHTDERGIINLSYRPNRIAARLLVRSILARAAR